MVFFATARVTQFMAELFCAAGVPVMDIHSRKSQGARTRTSNEFRAAAAAIMFTSDVSARGMDYPDVSFVLQVGSASSREQYVHRIGRSGRAGKSGQGLVLLSDWESFFLNDIRDLPVKPFPSASAPGFGNIAQQPRLQQAISRVASTATGNASSERASQAYQAWLGYYNGLQRRLHWNPTQLVNSCSCSCCSRPHSRSSCMCRCSCSC